MAAADTQTTPTDPAELKATLDARHRKKATVGLVVIVILAVLTGLEYWVAVAMGESYRILGLTATAVLKAWLIVQYFMHIAQFWQSGDAH